MTAFSFHHHRDMADDRSMRRREHYGRWRDAVLNELIRMARAGESWEMIGLTFYPNATSAARVRTAACEAFRRHATTDDRRARAAAIRARNCNKPPGISDRTERRRRAANLDDRAVMTPAVDPWAGLGDCFADAAARRAA